MARLTPRNFEIGPLWVGWVVSVREVKWVNAFGQWAECIYIFLRLKYKFDQYFC